MICHDITECWCVFKHDAGKCYEACLACLIADMF